MGYDYDVVYYWSGGEEIGQWHEVPCSGEITVGVIINEIERGGRVAYPGKLSIGAPEGPPPKYEFDRVLRDPRLPSLR